MSGQYEDAMDALYKLQAACEQCHPQVFFAGLTAREIAEAARIAGDCMRRQGRAEDRVKALEQAIRSHTVNLGDLADLIAEEH